MSGLSEPGSGLCRDAGWVGPNGRASSRPRFDRKVHAWVSLDALNLTLALTLCLPNEIRTEAAYRVPGRSLRPLIFRPSSDQVTDEIASPVTLILTGARASHRTPVSCAVARADCSATPPPTRATQLPTAVQTTLDPHETACS